MIAAALDKMRSRLVPAWRAATRLSSRLVPARLRPRLLDAATLGTIAALHAPLARPFRFATTFFDEEWFLWEGWSMTKGLVPYRDFQETKPPVIFFVNCLAIKLFGLTGGAYRQFFYLMSLVAFLAAASALLSWGTNRLLVIGLSVFMIGHLFDTNMHSELDDAESVGVCFFLMGTAALLAKTPPRFTGPKEVLGGALLSLVPLSKEPLVFPTVAAWACMLVVTHYDGGSVRAFARRTIGGVLGVVAVWVAYMLATRSLGWYLVEVHLEFAYAKYYATQLGWTRDMPFVPLWLDIAKRSNQAYVNAEHLSPFVPFGMAIVLLWRHPGRRWVVVTAGLTVFGGLYAATMSHAIIGHYFVMAMTGTFLVGVVGALALGSRDVEARWARWAGAFVLFAALFQYMPRYQAEADKWSTYKPVPQPVSADLVEFVRNHSSPGDRIFNLGTPSLYVFADRISAVREGPTVDEYITHYPGSTDTERLSGERAQLEEHMPKLVVFGPDPVGTYGRKRRLIESLVMPFIHAHGYVELRPGVIWGRPY
jgi:hypothetical protein